MSKSPPKPVYVLECDVVTSDANVTLRITPVRTDTNERLDTIACARQDIHAIAEQLAALVGKPAAEIARELLDAFDDADLRPVPLGQIWDEASTPREPIIDGLLRRGQVGNLISTSKSYKTFLTMSLAICYIEQRAWLDRFPCTGGKVLIVDLELQKPDITLRTRDISKALGVSSENVRRDIEILSLRGRASSFDKVERLLMAKDPGRYDLIIIDPLYKCYPDPFDENSNAQMTMLFRRFERLAEYLNAAILIVHHATKGSQAEKRVVDVGAGAGSQARSADAHITLREHEVPGAAIMDARVRSFVPVDPLCLRWEYPIWRRDDTLDPTAIRTGRKSRNHDATQPQPKEKAEPWTPERFVKEFLSPDPIDKKLLVALARAKDVAVNKIDNLLTLALHQKLAHEWASTGTKKRRYATIEQPVTDFESKGKQAKELDDDD
jgi:hypothetical protein